MHDSRSYRDNAAHCLLAAQEACQPHFRKLRLSMAISWLSLARQDEAMDNLLASQDTAPARGSRRFESYRLRIRRRGNGSQPTARILGTGPGLSECPRARALIRPGWCGSKTEIIFSICLTAHATHRITRNPSTDGTMRAGPRAVATVRSESARATPTFRKKLPLRRVQRSRLNGPVRELVREPPLLSFPTDVMEPDIDLRTYTVPIAAVLCRSSSNKRSTAHTYFRLYVAWNIVN
jgi:hypothetical protein